MPIISTSFNDIGNSGQVPSLSRIETDDSLDAVLVVGYLNVLTHQNLPLSENSIVLVSLGTGVNKSVTAMRMVFSSGDWSLELLEGYQESLDGLTLPTATVASGDKVLIQDISDSSKLKTVTAQSIADLVPGGGGVFNQLSVTVTPTEMKTILSNPGKLIIPAQGANKLIVVNSVIYEYTYNSVVYAAGDVVYLAYDITGGWFITVGIPAVDFQQPASPTIQDIMKPQDAYTGNGVAINKDVYMYANSNFTNGNSTVTVHVTYQVVTTVNT